MHQKKIQQAKEFEKNGKYWEAAKLYQESLILLNKNTGNEKEKSFCKQKIKQMNIKRSEEFTKIKTSHSFTEEEINQIQNEIHEILDTENIDELLIEKNTKLCHDGFCRNAGHVRDSKFNISRRRR